MNRLWTKVVLAMAGTWICVAAHGELLFRVPWGEGDGSLSAQTGPDGEVLCVQTWTRAEDGRFLFLDPVRRTLEAFDTSGRWIGTLRNGVSGDSIEWDTDNAVWVLDGKRLRRLAADGAETESAMPTAVPPGVGQGLRRRPDDDGVEIADRGRRRWIVRGRSGQSERERDGARTERALERALERADETPPRIERSGDGIRWRRGDRDTSIAGETGSVIPCGMDRAGTTWLEVERRDADGDWRLEVHGIDDGPRRIARTGPCDDISVVYRRVLIGMDGAVFRMRTRPDGVEIHRYPATDAEVTP